jgi:hypothetical protein
MQSYKSISAETNIKYQLKNREQHLQNIENN